jgi:hypothetical protein
MDNEWEQIDRDTQGETIADFVCSKGKLGAENIAAGHTLPFDSGRTMLATLTQGKNK